MKKVEPRFKPKSLFGNPNPAVIVVKEPELKESVVKKDTIVKESNIDGWVSQYIPNADTDRFVLISPKNERFACKFYNPIRKDFVGASMLSMYNLRDHFDRSIIPEDEGLK